MKKFFILYLLNGCLMFAYKYNMFSLFKNFPPQVGK